MRDLDDRTIRDALLRQAEANRAISNAIFFQTQRIVSKESAAVMELDRLESCYCADRDANDASSIAGQIVKAASPPIASCAIGTKRVIPSVLELLTASSKAGVPTPSGAETGQGLT